MSSSFPQKREADADAESLTEGPLLKSPKLEEPMPLDVSSTGEEGISIGSNVFDADVVDNQDTMNSAISESADDGMDSLTPPEVSEPRIHDDELYDSDDSFDEEGEFLKELVYEEVSPEEDVGLDLAIDDLDILNKIKFTKKTVTQARHMLRNMGYHKFLDHFVRSENTPTSDDVFKLVKLLGFSPKVKKSELSTKNVHDAIYYLQQAIIRVQKKRARLTNFYKIDTLKDALEKAQNVMVLTGAGISTSLGIPDFRSSKGFYSQLHHMGLSDPQDVFSLSIFQRNPEIFYSVAHMVLPPERLFAPLHSFIKLLQDKNKLLRNYTQNIDNFEAHAGLDPEKIVQCHGSFATASCITCKYKVPGETLFPNLRAQEIAYCPFCLPERRKMLKLLEKMEDSGIYKRGFDQIPSYGVMKPDITFFGEDLPERFHELLEKDVRECDLLICIGTSLKVQPVSEIVDRLSEDVPQILINRDEINHHEFDIELLGYCDQVATWLCKEMGWEIPHKDFETIKNSGLEMKILDENLGTYFVNDANQREEALRAAAAAAESSKVSSSTPATSTSTSTASPNVDVNVDVDVDSNIIIDSDARGNGDAGAQISKLAETELKPEQLNVDTAGVAPLESVNANVVDSTIPIPSTVIYSETDIVQNHQVPENN